MGIKWFLRRQAESFTGSYILKRSELPRGYDIFVDISENLKNYKIDTIFDVGANIGQSAEQYNKIHPFANIYCFEPIYETFQILKNNVVTHDNTKCFQFALGATNTKGTMLSEGTSTMNHLMAGSENIENDAHYEKVEVKTLDDFCRENSISSISYLKIDTEGGDLDVLKGSKTMLEAQNIDLIEVEAGMNPRNKHHVPFEKLKSLLEE